VNDNQTVLRHRISMPAVITRICGIIAFGLLGGCIQIGDNHIAGYDFPKDTNSTNTYTSGAGGGSTAGTEATQPDFAGTGGNEPVTHLPSVEEACVTLRAEGQKVRKQIQVQVTEPAPVAVYFMLDQSSSMANFVKFPAAVDAVTWFVGDPSSTNLDVALQYFPLRSGVCETGEAYRTPEVPLSRLPGGSAGLTSSLECHSNFLPLFGFVYGTPMEGALRGATQFCSQFKSDPIANPEREDCVAVLVTDGEPNACTVNDGPGLAQIAKEAFDTSGVKTFTIGMTGADFAVLNQIGVAGGTDCTPADATSTACDVSSGGDAFVEALKLIRTTITKTIAKTVTRLQALECEWTIPLPPQGEVIDFSEVNVQFSPTGADTDAQIIGRVNTIADCGRRRAWYYDDEFMPRRIIACDEACKTIKAAIGAKINILLGCATEYIVE
jgi:hypothetical protein